MKLIANRPILVGNKVVAEGAFFETDDRHGDELKKKKYAREGNAEDAAPSNGSKKASKATK